MHIDNASRQYVTASGEKRVSRCFLLRRSFRDKLGRPRNETLANLSALDDPMIAAVDKMPKGTTLVDVDDVFETERSVPHGDVAAAHVMAQKLGIANLLGEACKQRDIAYGLILARALRPGSKLSTASWWESEDTTLGVDLEIDSASTDDIHQAMDWLVTKQSKRSEGALHVDRSVPQRPQMTRHRARACSACVELSPGRSWKVAGRSCGDL